jgi:D-sedoheptulose 7-phosphate isomerase
MTERVAAIEAAFLDTIRLHDRAMREDAGALLAVVDAVGGALRRGGQVLACGNGGSAADSQHFPPSSSVDSARSSARLPPRR